MKIRNGFVSNSSSTAFVLDIRNSEVANLLPKIYKLRNVNVDGVRRTTGSAVGRDVVEYCKFWNSYMFDVYEDTPPFVEWLREHIKEIGENNIVFIRESDEDMGGSLSDVGLSYLDIDKLAIDKYDYH